VNFSLRSRFGLLGLGLTLAGCSPAAPAPQAAEPLPPIAPAPLAPPPPTAAAEAAPPPPAADDARGGRLYDNWRSEKALEKTFTADSSKTPALDGVGGPNGNGTLNDAQGKPLANTGHDYRLKNLLGWDLRGAQGVYGADYQKKAFVLTGNLLTDTRSAEALRAWFEKGGEGLPAFGAVLDARDLDDLVAFVVKTRAKELVSPEAVFKLEKTAPKGFVLNSGGDATRGKAAFAARCAKCHGDDGRKMAIDEVESVGSIARSSGYEIWFKIAHGQPGTTMGRQLTETGGAAQAQTVLDLFAALCDRKAYPALATGKDVPNGDARCGSYLR
jgi:cytochrome c553